MAYAQTDGSGGLDARALLRLARDRSARARSQLVDVIGDLFSDQHGALSERERSLMSDILRQLVHDVEVEVRKHLAIRLSDDANAPHDLVLALANDAAEVAHPILARSTVLRDPDLIEIVRNRTLEHQLAVALRSSLSEAVSEALVETGDEAVISTLLENRGARIAEETLAYVVEQSQRIDAFQNPLVRRHDLPKSLAERMYWWVSAALRAHIVQHFDVDPDDIDDAIEKAVAAAQEAAGSEQARNEITARLAGELAKDHGCDGRLMIRVLKTGEVALFEALLEVATGLRRYLVQRLIYEPGGEGLAIACRALEVPVEDFTMLHALCQKARPERNQVYPVGRAQASSFYEQIQPNAAQKVLDRWRRHPDYLDLLRQVDALTG